MHKYTNEEEIIAALELQVFLLEKQLTKNQITSSAIDEIFVDGLTLGKHDLAGYKPLFFTKNLFEIYDMSLEAFLNKPLETAQDITFPGDFEKSVKIVSDHFLSEQSNLPISFIQRLRMAQDKQNYEGVFTVTKKIPNSSEILSIGVNVKYLGWAGNKMARLLEETLYMRRNFHKFANLTTREREIITLLALGYQNHEIAGQLFIAKATVEQHRKNLKRKLEVKRFVDIVRFAQAFDLI